MAAITSSQTQSPLLAPLELEREFHISQWLEVLRRRRSVVIVVCLVVLVVSLLQYATTPKSYRATIIIQIERRVSGPVKVEDIIGLESYWDAQSFYPTQFKLLESRGMAERVVRYLRLAEDPLFNPSRARLLPGGRPAPASAADDDAAVARLAYRVLGGLSVRPIKDTRLVEISYTAPSGELAARVCNGVAEAYIDWGIEMRGLSVGKASSFLSSQIEALKQEIQDKESQLQAYSRRTDIVALDPASNVTLGRLEALNKDYIAAVSERINKESKYQQIINAPKETIADPLSAGLVGQLRSELLKLEGDYATKLHVYKPEWPAMQDLKAQIDNGRARLESVIEETVGKAKEAARADYQTALRLEQSLTEELARQKVEALRLNSAAVEYNNLKLEVSTRRTLLDELLRKQSETEVASRMQGSRESNVVIVDRALPPGGPYRPSLNRSIGFGLGIGLGLGIAMVFLLDYLDRTLKTAEDVERVLGLPVLGVIPDVSTSRGRYGYYYTSYYSYYGRSGKRGKSRKRSKPASSDEVAIELVCTNLPRLAVSEAYRALRTALLLSTAHTLRTLLVTSASMGEGKSATSCNLAVALAQLGRDVLLIDADLRKPRQHEVFKVSNRVGAVSLLTGLAEPELVFLRTSVPNLYLTPSGPIPPNPAELLSSERMREFLALARQRFDYIVIDTSPVLPVTDATILSALVDGVVLCIGVGQVLREAAKTCHERLAIAEAHILGVVLNRFREVPGRYRRHYYHQYQAYLQDVSEETASSAAEAG